MLPVVERLMQSFFEIYTFTFMHLADAFIQSDLQLHSGYTFLLVRVPWESNPQPFAQLTQCSTTEPHGNIIYRGFDNIEWNILTKQLQK